MKFAKQVITLIGCLALGIFLSCASSIEQQTTQIKKASTLPILEQIAKIRKDGTVQIGSLNVEDPSELDLGSGFFIEHDLIATNIHVVNEKSFAGAVSLVRLVNKPTWFTIKGVIASDPIRDLVILKVVKLGGEDPHILPLGDSDTVQRGDSIVAIGNPGEGDKIVRGDVSTGVISRRTPNFLGISARNNRKGYSGGPVLNVHGKVIGIMYQGHRVGSGYAIPSNYLRALLKNMPIQEKSLEKWREEPLIRHYSTEDAEGPEKLANALKNCDLVIQLTPNYADAYRRRGYVKKKLGDFKGAIKDYDTAIRKGADYAYIYVSRGDVKAKIGDKKGAIKDYGKAIHLDPAYVDAYGSRASAKSDLGNEKGAIEDYNTVIRLKPETDLLALAHLNRGLAKSNLGNKKKAIEDYNTVIRLKPKDGILAAAYINRGTAKSKLGNKKEAVEDYNTVIRLKPDDGLLALAYMNRANTKSDLGDNYAAIQDCNTVIGLTRADPILAEAYNIRGEAKSAQGDNINSIKDYDKAIQLEPNHAEFYYNRGVANAALRRTSEAETDFKTALKLLERRVSGSKSVNKKTGASGWNFYLSVRPDLKADIKKALRELE
ncbi:MAG: tetratricopeptide repeat-containing serine protease family protein [Candidatus Poribacteria bacterium]|nr:tetratricopeptide repeat-containing serine protease family protein [Candidatus Poribacteria bacterium]